MQNLFGDLLCSEKGGRFVHDEVMYEGYCAREGEDIGDGEEEEERRRGAEEVEEEEGDSWRDGSMGLNGQEVPSPELQPWIEGDGGAGGMDDEGGVQRRPSVAAYFPTNSRVKRRSSIDGRNVGSPQYGRYHRSSTTSTSSPDPELYDTVPQSPLHNNSNSNTFISQTNEQDEPSRSHHSQPLPPQEGEEETDDYETETETENDTQRTISTSAFESQSQSQSQDQTQTQNPPRTETERAQQIKRRKRMYAAIGQTMSRGEGVDLGLSSTIRDGRGYDGEEVEI